jgi:hypothetical protein
VQLSRSREIRALEDGLAVTARFRFHEPPSPSERPPAVIWLLLLASERPKEKPLGDSRTGDRPALFAERVRRAAA